MRGTRVPGLLEGGSLGLPTAGADIGNRVSVVLDSPFPLRDRYPRDEEDGVDVLVLSILP